jgi:AraC-like DNA-binding protein
MVLHPDEAHNGRAGVVSGFGYRMLYIEQSRIREALDLASLPFVPEIVFDDAAFARTILAAFECFPRSWPELESDALITRIADHSVQRSDARRKPQDFIAPRQLMKRVRLFLDAEFKRPVCSLELERLTSLSRYAIARHFRTCYGTSPYRYLVMRRLAEAKRRILQGVPIVTAAIELGFADQSHLTRCFHQMFGLPPGRLQRLCRSTGSTAKRHGPFSNHE